VTTVRTQAELDAALAAGDDSPAVSDEPWHDVRAILRVLRGES
jgi:hypothetical protein